MHELMVTHNILNTALDEAKAARANKIININLIIGELSGVTGESIQFYFNSLSKDTAAEKATIDFKLVPAELRCRDCSTKFGLEDVQWICPNCRSSRVEIIDGRDCFIESIDVE